MSMFKTKTNPGNGHLVDIYCRRCPTIVTMSVIALSRLQHPPLCPQCQELLDAATALAEPPVRE